MSEIKHGGPEQPSVLEGHNFGTFTPEENPLESIKSCIAFDVMDWSLDRRHAWIYAVVFGVGNRGALKELIEAHNWTDEDVARLRRLHVRFSELNKRPVK